MQQQTQQFDPASFECREAAPNNGMQPTAIKGSVYLKYSGKTKECSLHSPRSLG